jgi:hypothetical protein
VTRGRQTQELAAEWFRRNGWPEAESRAASLPGTDIKNMPNLAPEVKATEGQDFLGALRQAKANSKGDLPFVIYRPRGFGPEKIGDWIVATSLREFTDLLQLAGFNDGQVQR